ncbi:hypothetical protein QCA50_007597 [Cerrena zonata]|uniref:Cytochrome P450 n=1 Tax=Cerrena zonata TaxID=2478898 RepID=A0AAW0GHI8_9APHY
MSFDDSNVCYYVTVLLPFAMGVLIPWCLFKAFRTNTKVIVSSLAEIQHILNPASATIEYLVGSRARSNTRLVRAFHLTNTFVSIDTEVHRAFVREAKRLIPLKGFGFPFGGLAAQITAELGRSICSKPSKVDFDYAKFIQILTFKVMISTLFKVDLDSMDTDDVVFVTTGINTLWNLSKTTANFPPGLLEGINRRVSYWITDIENPLNLIIPVYETMWQVVAIGVVLLHHDPRACRLLETYLQNPTPEQFARWEGSEASVQSLISETLRLYPPVRRISRIISTRPAWVPSCLDSYFQQSVSADISILQRDMTIWGQDANAFDASRHYPSKLTQEQASTLLAFSAGRIKCVASSWAPQAASLLIAAMVKKVNEEGLEGIDIKEGSKLGSRDGWGGWKVISRHSHH